MDGIKHSRQFAEMERLVSDYFHCHLAPVMSKTQAYLTKKQGEEMREYSTSLGGILSAMASAAQPMGDPYQVLKVTGEWNSKTTEDYIGMCKAEITGSKEIQQDLAYMAGQWRDTVVQEIGRKRYDELSEQLGGDLAYAYMDYRVEELMIDRDLSGSVCRNRQPTTSSAKPQNQACLDFRRPSTARRLLWKSRHGAKPPTVRKDGKKARVGYWAQRQIP